MTSTSRAWSAGAAYLYVLHLDAPSLAWEYLRRNSLYWTDWRNHGHGAARFIDRWGIVFLENPASDASVVQPLWGLAPDILVRICAHNGEDAVGVELFSLWSIPGRKALLDDGRKLFLTAIVGARVLRMVIEKDVSHSESFAYVIPSGPQARARCQVLINHLATVRSARAGAYSATKRPGSVALVHMRTLQALDGQASDASHREIAAAIFGEERVAENWHADSELRAQVRHLLRRGDALMSGGYRRFIENDVR